MYIIIYDFFEFKNDDHPHAYISINDPIRGFDKDFFGSGRGSPHKKEKMMTMMIRSLNMDHMSDRGY